MDVMVRVMIRDKALAKLRSSYQKFLDLWIKFKGRSIDALLHRCAQLVLDYTDVFIGPVTAFLKSQK